MSSRYDKQSMTGQLVSYLPNSYRERTSRPIYALVYLLGFLALYEIGTLMVQPEALTQSLAQPQIRVVAFVWVQNVLEFLGFSNHMTWYAAPLVVVVILLALQITSQTSWKVRGGDFVVMTLECIAYSIPLIVLSMLLNRAVAESNAGVIALNTMTQNRLILDVITGIGAGIYEELIFRLVLICLLMLLFQDILGFERKNAVIWSVLISAVLFSAHHHFFFANGQLHKGDPFTIGKFVFRAMAGVYFAILYATRGFGITAGTHAFYNILAALIRMLVLTLQAD